jgi:hypothetical protein
MALVVSGCASSGTTLTRPGDKAQVIYQIAEDQAFTIALDAYAALYPNKSVDDVVEGDRRGYNADERTWAGDWWHHRILVIPRDRHRSYREGSPWILVRLLGGWDICAN